MHDLASVVAVGVVLAELVTSFCRNGDVQLTGNYITVEVTHVRMRVVYVRRMQTREVCEARSRVGVGDWLQL